MEDMLKRFNLRNGQFFAYYAYKNLQWFLNGVHIGFGDLRDDDILHIAVTLEDGEEFVGWNEHHGTQWQQTDLPMLKIASMDIKLRQDIIKENGGKRS